MIEKLFVSDGTVRTHLQSINAKIAASSPTQAIAIARRLGLIIWAGPLGFDRCVGTKSRPDSIGQVFWMLHPVIAVQFLG